MEENDRRQGTRVRVLILRSALGLVFAYLLIRWFFPAAGIVTILAAAALLVFFAYLFESVRPGNQ